MHNGSWAVVRVQWAAPGRGQGTINNRHMATRLATFAAGCFWGVEEAFRRTPGVLKTSVGYTGGHTADPTYKQVCTGRTGHAEACRVEFDPSTTSFSQLLRVFWRTHDPTQKDRQGPDHGTQYRSAVFYHDEGQREEAEASLQAAQAGLAQPIVTQIQPAGEYYLAEAYHQQYIARGNPSACHF